MAVARIDAATGKTELASARVAVQSAAAERPRADALVRDRFVARRFNGRDNVLSGLSAVVAEGAAGLAFQSAEWIEHALAIIQHRGIGEPVLIRIDDTVTGELVLAMPLVVGRRRGLTFAEGIDASVADYCAPLVGHGMPTDVDAVAGAIWSAFSGALGDVDVIALDKIPEAVVGKATALAAHPLARDSKFRGNRLEIADTVDAFVALRGKRYRKEAERCRRRLEEMGTVRFRRMASAAEAEAAYRQLETWQRERHLDAGHVYCLDEPDIRHFYLDLALAHLDTGFVSIFELAVDDVPIAILYGTEHQGTFTLLRIADAGGVWKPVSPGRMVVLEMMRYEVARDVRSIDMGIGDYPFKRWIGCEPYRLVDLVVARSIKGRPYVALDRLKSWARRHEQLRRAFQQIKRFSQGRAGKSGGSEPRDGDGQDES